MNFIGFTLISLISFMVTNFAFVQIVGTLFIKLPKKQFNCIIGLIFWSIIVFVYYYVIYNFFNDYLTLCIIISILTFIIALLNIKNMRIEDSMR